MPKFPWQIISQLKCFARGNFHMFMTAAMRGRKSNKREFHLCWPISPSLRGKPKAICAQRQSCALAVLCLVWHVRESRSEEGRTKRKWSGKGNKPVGCLYRPCISSKYEKLLFVLRLLTTLATCSLQRW